MEKVFKNSLLNILKVLSTLLFPLISYTYVTRVLSVESIGKVEFAKSFTSYFIMLSMLGIFSYGTREAAKLKFNNLLLSRFSHEILFINFIAVLLSLLSFFITFLSFDKLKSYELFLIINALSIVLMPLGMEWIYAATEDYLYIATRTIIVQFIGVILTIVFVRTKEDYYLYTLFQTLSISFPNFLNIIYSRKYIIWKYLGSYNLRRHIKPIITLFLISVSVQIFSSLDVTMLGFLTNSRTVGLYTAATKMTNITISLIVALTSVLLPKISILVENNNWTRLKDISYKSIEIILMFSIPASLGLSLLSKELIILLSGSSFMSATLASKILSLRVLLSPLNTFIMIQLLVSMKKEANNLLTTFVAALINLVLNYFLIPYYHQNGAAFSTVLAEIIELFFNFFFIKNFLNIKKIGFIFVRYSLYSLSILLTFKVFFLLSIDKQFILILVPLSVLLYFVVVILFERNNPFFKSYFEIIKHKIKYK